ncbi:electron transfer flavoprotein subunit beta/FixA family protein [Sphingomonas abietis]|uniref:Electron transfer flavoprotein alpha/beta-subunit N-terminal domain-containing protein n=1 Tax=Sphingomonas abietis TaxID=3012344 RepID=A0ABY7NMU6_9SPHN|nr:hypothetical protein [Sphingomonas abietis]WBO21973.1 hypothetical protein PBT88_17695 [Sphingomonas abietis]
MHVLVVMRLVPDTSEDVEIDASGVDIDREWVDLKLCEFDDHALEEAILLKERAGAKVTAIAIAGEGVDRMLQTATARGADQCIRIDYELDNPTSTAEAAKVVAEAIRSIGADLVLTGVLTTEDVLGQWAPFIAGCLGWPTVNAVSGIEAGGKGVIVRQEYSGGRSSRLDVPFPAVLGVQSASQPPRYVPGSKLRQAMGTPIEAKTIDVIVTGRSGTITALAAPEGAHHANMIDGDAEAVASAIADILAERSLV